MKPLVSIITPSYNQGRFIRETIESVLSQDYENIEYIVIDGGSTDDTLSILSEYDGKLKYISEKDHGQSDAINKGFKMANGEIVAWLNSDDVYEPGCISKAVEEFINNPRLSLLYGDGYIIDSNSNKLKVFEYTQEFDYWKLVNFWDYIMQPATFFSSRFLKEVGYLDENLHYCMDWDLWIKLASVGEVKYINQCLACSREYEETKTSTGGDRRLEEITGLLRKYSKNPEPLGIKSYKASTFYTKHAKGALLTGILGRYLGYVHKNLYKKMPIRYSDGWIGKEYKQIIPNYVEQITLYIKCPSPKLLPQRVEVFVNGIKENEIYVNDKEEKRIIVYNREKEFCEFTLLCGKTKRISKQDNRLLGLQIDV